LEARVKVFIENAEFCLREDQDQVIGGSVLYESVVLPHGASTLDGVSAAMEMHVNFALFCNAISWIVHVGIVG